MLTGGLATSDEALRALWRLEDRVPMIVWEGAQLRLAPREAVTDDIAVMVRAHREDLVALVRYVQQEGWTKPAGTYAAGIPEGGKGPTPEAVHRRGSKRRRAGT